MFLSEKGKKPHKNPKSPVLAAALPPLRWEHMKHRRVRGLMSAGDTDGKISRLCVTSELSDLNLVW